MTDYRNILRLHSQGHSQRSMERELNCSRHTISEVLVQAATAGLTWPLEDDVTNEDIQAILFPGKYAYTTPVHRAGLCLYAPRAGEKRCDADASVGRVLRQGSQRGRRSVFVHPVLREVPSLGTGD